MIEIKNLDHIYRNREEESLRDINLKIGKGERVALLGPSGSGKSTLISCISRLVEPRSGSILIEGRDILKANTKELKEIRRKIGTIFQGFNLIERENVFKNVLDGRLGYARTLKSCFNRFNEEDYKIVEDNLKEVGLFDLKDERVCDLSGGQKQRVAIARTLSQQPMIILADEPVSNLDPKLAREILHLLQKVCKEREITLITTIHFVDLIKENFPRIIGLVDGAILFDDDLEKYSQEQVLKKRLRELGYIDEKVEEYSRDYLIKKRLKQLGYIK